MKILLLEDEMMLNDAVVEFLKIHNHEVVSFFDGNRALESLKSEEYDLLILDINVPNINGLELLERLQTQKIQTPTIFISALVDLKTIAKGFELGADD